jgi:SSS family solute:Na+ symporter
MQPLDWVMIGGYFALLLGVVWWVVSKSKDTAADYFLAGRNLSWWIVGASIFASNIGSEHVVGLAGSGAKDGVAMAHYELHAWCLLVLGWVFVPFYARSLVFTMPEFLERRFSTGSRYVLSIVSLITFVVSKIAVGIFAGGIVFSTLLPEMNIDFGKGHFTKDNGVTKVDATDDGKAVKIIDDPAHGIRIEIAEKGKEVDRYQAKNLNELKKTGAGYELYKEYLLERPMIDSFWIGSVLVIVLTGLYTILGGMRAVAYNDAIQTVVLIIGSATLTIYGLWKLGHGNLAEGWSQVKAYCAPRDMLNLWKPLVPEGVEGTWAPVLEKDAAGRVVRQAWYFNDHFPWLGMAICAPVIGLWYWCTDQYIVQRALGAPNEKTARRGSIFAAFLKLFPVYLFIIPGLICYALVSTAHKSGEPITDSKGRPSELMKIEQIDSANPDLQQQAKDAAQKSFPLMVKDLLPMGLRGIVVAGLLSALMGSLAGVFNACSTLFTVDLYEKWRPGASQHQIVRVGRIATGVMVVIALAWIPVVKGANSLYEYLQGVQGYLAPPIFVVFFLGVFFKRLNAKGCWWAMVVGFVLGIFRMAVDTPVQMKMAGFENGYAPNSFLWIINNIYFQYFSILITLVSAVVMVAVSLMTAPPSAVQIKSLTFGTATEEDKRKTRESWGAIEVIASLVVLAAIIGAYLYFRG